MSHHSSGGGGNATECKMTMLFNTHTIDACFLTADWHIKNEGMFAATCIGVLLLVVVLEAARRLGKEYDDFLARSWQRRAAEAAEARRLARDKDPEGGRLAAAALGACQPTAAGAALLAPAEYATFRATPPQQLVRAVLHAVTFGLAYIVMLIAMYYNVILLVMIVLGAGIGKFFCDWMTRTILIDGGGPAGGGATAAGPAKAVGVEEPSVCCG
ncbi:hypothetical protein RB601_006956 [Gaeumannomyces tritici]